MLDNVYFDANSFTTSGRTVTLVGPTSIASMDWTGVTNAPTFAVASNTVNIYGSLTLATGMTVTNWTIANFLSTSTGNTITSGGRSVGTATLVFNGVGGGWTLQDALICGNLTLTNGSFNTNDQTVTANFINSSNSNVRSLSIGSSIINLTCNACDEWNITTTTNLTFTSGASTINMKGGNANFYGGGKTYNNLNGIVSSAYRISTGTFNTINLTSGGSLTNCTVTNFICDGYPLDACTGNTVATATISKNATFSGDNTFGTLNLTGAGAAYIFQSAKTQTIQTALNITGGSCSAMVSMSSSSAGSRATISQSSGSMALDYVNIKDMAATGGATFTVNNAINSGNNLGWTITTVTAQNYYWVGGSGNWTDGTHWSLTSGGAPSGCGPTMLDNVYFDANSFTTSGRTVTLVGPTSIASMD
jgi:predicted RecA/RadA family phage recombinase